MIVFTAIYKTRFLLLESGDIYTILSIMAGIRITAYLTKLIPDPGKHPVLDLLLSTTLPFLTLIVILIIAMIARILWTMNNP